MKKKKEIYKTIEYTRQEICYLVYDLFMAGFSLGKIDKMLHLDSGRSDDFVREYVRTI